MESLGLADSLCVSEGRGKEDVKAQRHFPEAAWDLIAHKPFGLIFLLFFITITTATLLYMLRGNDIITAGKWSQGLKDSEVTNLSITCVP